MLIPTMRTMMTTCYKNGRLITFSVCATCFGDFSSFILQYYLSVIYGYPSWESITFQIVDDNMLATVRSESDLSLLIERNYSMNSRSELKLSLL